jgi:hypothetical protein
MKSIGLSLLCCAAFAGAVSAQQQAAAPARAAQPRPLPGMLMEVRNIFNTHKGNITKAADQFPEDKYGWSPTPEVRTWGGLISHIVDDNNNTCSVLIGVTPPPRLDLGGKPTDAGRDLKKADIVKKLADSFAVCDKAFETVTDANMAERAGNTSRSKFGTLFYDTQHINEHYGNIVTYMRLQGMVPPSSAPRGGGPAF